jgi:tetratricopeptide (TPR) repeat protein
VARSFAPALETANLEKAIEIKRRAQRCIQNGDLDGALAEYEKLVAAEDADPYNFVLLADLLYKKGDTSAAGSRYLTAATAYEKAGLYKNGIAVCKKMMRLSLSASPVLQRLAVLHELDGLSTESALYYSQFAENMVREDNLEAAVTAFRKSFDTCPENVKALERLAEVLALKGDREQASTVLVEAATHYQRAGQLQDADRCRNRAAQMKPGGAEKMVAETAARQPVGSVMLDAKQSLSEASQAVVEPKGAKTKRMVEAGPPLEITTDSEVERVGGSGGPPRLPVTEDSSADPWFEGSATPSVNHTPADPMEIDPGAGIPTGSQIPRLPSEQPAPEDLSAEADEDEDDSAPGLQFEAPAADGEEAAPKSPALLKVEKLLAQAQELFRSGNREAAGLSLAEAAREYDTMGQHDSAATIYRSLSKGAHAGAEIMMTWLRNCEMRGDRVEAAQVACELGDRALNDGDGEGAKRWFERAGAFDPANGHAQRRLQRLTPPSAAPEAAQEEEAAPGAPPMEMGRVEVAVGRGEAVTFDLGSLVSEFQRGVEMQLSGDAQGHYDLGVAYREMGLLEQAVEAFNTAAQDPAFGARCAEMVGRCLLDQGRFDEAVEEFTRALEQGRVGPEMAADLRYQLGLAQEAAGRLDLALAEFERVYAAQSNYPDVALKIRVLRKTLERP